MSDNAEAPRGPEFGSQRAQPLKIPPTLQVPAVLTAAAVAVIALVGAAVLCARQSILGIPFTFAEFTRIALNATALHSNAEVHHAVRLEFWVVGLTALGLLLGCWSAAMVLRARVRRWGHFGLLATAIALLCMVTCNLLLLFSGVRTLPAALAAVAFTAFVPALTIAVAGITLTALRAVTTAADSPRRRLSTDDYVSAVPLTETDLPEHVTHPHVDGLDGLDGHAAPAQHERWARAYLVPTCGHERRQTAQITGIGFSGGGVRAASTAMGVMQSSAFRANVVNNADYLVSVSGGGYTAGAFAQLLTTRYASDEHLIDPHLVNDAFMIGTPEEDYVRRHSSYLADTPVRLAGALGMIAWHLLLNVILLFGAGILLGVVTGFFYRAVPLAGFDRSLWDSLEHGDSPRFPDLRTGAYWALGVAAGLTALLWLADHFIASHPNAKRLAKLRPNVRLFRTAGQLITALIALLTVVVPTLIWLSCWFLHHTRGGDLHALTPLAAVAVSYGGTLFSLGKKKASTLTRSASALPTSLPAGFTSQLLVIGLNGVVGVSWLVLLGSMASAGLHPIDTTGGVALAGVAAVVLFLGCCVDMTTLSLHPFYRARLACTFAVRRLRMRGGHVVAQPYDPTERTTLSQYGATQAGFPHVIFAASATLGEHRAPPGSSRVSYTFCSHWVGGPDVGWVKTSKLEQLSPERLKRDLTVQAAVALSGAAIADSLGGQGSTWYESIFALTGVRLGAWLPNPRFVIERFKQRPPFAMPGIPRIRRLSYLLRELIGLHAADGPLLQVTDGGFYDNLGLLELFRRGCTRIYLVDASGDSPPLASTLAHTLLVAQRELGVTTTLEDDVLVKHTVGGVQQPLDPSKPLEALNARLVNEPLVRATFTYPDCGPSKNQMGELIIAKASLWPGLSYQLLTYANSNKTFPNDSTADQFFDADKYTAYTELGRCLGDAMAAAAAPSNVTIPAPIAIPQPIA